MQRIDIAAFGEILIDFTDRGVNADGHRLFAQIPGGAPANVAVAGRRLGANTAFIGKAGADMHGRFLKDVLHHEGVDVSSLLLDENCFTTLAFVQVNEQGERSFSFARKPGADTRFTPEEVPAELLKRSAILHVGSLSLTDEPARSATFHAIKQARDMGCIISCDPNYRASLWPDEATAIRHMRSLILHSDVMKISDEETVLLTGFADPVAAAAALVDQGVQVAAVTLGGDGAYVCTREGGKHVPGYRSVVADTNGAGDSFWGGFLYCLSQSGKRPGDVTLDEAAAFARFGNAVASLCVEKRGAIPAMPNLAQVQERLAEMP